MTETPTRITGYDDDGPSAADFVFGDPTPAEVAASQTNALAQLEQELSQDAERKDELVLVVPARPNIALRFDPNITYDQRKSWQERAKAAATKNSNRQARRRITGNDDVEPDLMTFSCLVLANTCTGFVLGGQTANRDDGRPLTFRDEKLWQMLKATGPEHAIRKLYGNDSHVENTANDVLLASGLDDPIESAEGGPTGAS